MNDDVQVLDSGQDTDTSTYTPYEMIEFENGTLVTPASANLETGAVTMPVYSGKAPINAINLNHLEQGLKNLEEYVLSGGVIGGGGGNAPIGSVMIWHGSTAPTGYLICDGSEYGRNSYPDLYDALGVDYQINTEQFKVPDFRGLVPIGAGEHQDTNSKSNTFTLGTEYGEYEHTQTLSEMPNHAHGLTQGYVTEGQSAGYARTGFDGASGLSGTAGEGQPFNIMQPSLAVNFIIKAVKSETTLAEVENSLTSNSTVNAPSIHTINENLVSITESQLDVSDTKCTQILANKLRKQNKLVTLDFEAFATNFENGYNLAGTISSEYLPMSSGYNDDVLCYFTCPISGLGRIIMGRITNTGRVEIYNDTADTTVRVGYIPNELSFRIHTSWFIE